MNVFCLEESNEFGDPGAECYRRNVCILPNLCFEALTLKMMVFGGKAFGLGRLLSSDEVIEGGAPMIILVIL